MSSAPSLTTISPDPQTTPSSPAAGTIASITSPQPPSQRAGLIDVSAVALKGVEVAAEIMPLDPNSLLANVGDVGKVAVDLAYGHPKTALQRAMHDGSQWVLGKAGDAGKTVGAAGAMFVAGAETLGSVASIAANPLRPGPALRRAGRGALRTLHLTTDVVADANLVTSPPGFNLGSPLTGVAVAAKVVGIATAGADKLAEDPKGFCANPIAGTEGPVGRLTGRALHGAFCKKSKGNTLG